MPGEAEGPEISYGRPPTRSQPPWAAEMNTETVSLSRSADVILAGSGLTCDMGPSLAPAWAVPSRSAGEAALHSNWDTTYLLSNLCPA